MLQYLISHHHNMHFIIFNKQAFKFSLSHSINWSFTKSDTGMVVKCFDDSFVNNSQVKASLSIVNMVQSLSDDRREESLQDRVLLTTLYLLVGGTLSLMWVLSWLCCKVNQKSEWYVHSVLDSNKLSRDVCSLQK